MPYPVQLLVRRFIEFYTLEECKTTIHDDPDDEEDELNISFVMNEPSKLYTYNLYMIINKTNEELENLQCSKLYKVSSTLEYRDITMKKVYASDKIIDNSIEEIALKNYKIKLVTVPLIRRKRKWIHTKSARKLLNDEPVLKKSKINKEIL